MIKMLYVILISSILMDLIKAEIFEGNLDLQREVRALGRRLRMKAMIEKDVSEMSVYYNISSNNTITNMSPRPWFVPGQPLRLPFIGEPCSCSGYQCGCCGGIRIPQFNIDRQACMNFTYDSYLFGVVMEIELDGNVVYHTVFSAKNPPRVCIPVPIGGIPGIDVCIRIFDLYMPGRNIHFCVDMETRIATAPILVLHFDCIQMGQDGVMFLKPEDQVIVATTDEPSAYIEETVTQEAVDTYDEVTEKKKINSTTTESSSTLQNDTEIITLAFSNDTTDNGSLVDNNQIK